MSFPRLACAGAALVAAGLFVPSVFVPSVCAQSITPATDGTGTRIQLNGNTYEITGGTSAGQNLFHSFERFGLTAAEVADFLSDPGVSNIFGRVVGGDPSIIEGLIQVTGANSNLYLMNPAGIVFGANARLNVGGDFVATTANRIGFAGDQWLESVGLMDYSSLLGVPVSFVFTANNGVIINQGDLAVGKNKALAMLGSGAVTVGSLAAPEGIVSVAAVPGESGLVRLSQPGQLLGYEFVPQLGQVVSSHDIGALVTAPESVGLPKALAAGAVLGSGVMSAGAAEVRGLDVGLGDFVAAGGVVARADRNVVVDGDIEAGGDVRLLGDQDGVDGGSLTISNAEIRTGGGNFEGVGRGSSTEPHGISVSGSMIDGEGGNIDLDGVGGSDTSVIDHHGINIKNNSSIVSVGSGQINIVGIGGDGLFEPTPGRFRGNPYGVNIDQGSLNTERGSVFIDGTAGAEGTRYYGINMSDTNITTQQGDISLEGEGDENTRINRNVGVHCLNCNLQTSSSHTGTINITGESAWKGIVYSSGSISSGSGGVNISGRGYDGVSISTAIRTYLDGNISILSVGNAGVGNSIQAEDGDVNISLSESSSSNINDGGRLGLGADIRATGDGSLNIFSAGIMRGSGFFDSGHGSMSFELGSSGSFFLEDLDLKTQGQNVEFIGHGLSIGDVDLSSSTGNGGTLIHQGSDKIKIGSINTSGLIDGGDINLRSFNSGTTGNNEIVNAIEIGNINTFGGRDGGDISIFSWNNPIVVSGTLDTSGGRDGGDISITSAGRVITQGLNSNSQRNAGDIYLQVRRKFNANIGFFGEIDTTAGIISAAGGLNGGNVTLRADTDINTGTITMFNPGFNGDGGRIDIRSIGGKIDTTRGDLISASGLGVGGNVNLEALGGISIGDVNAESISTNGGEIRFRSSRIHTQGNIATNDNSITFTGSTNLQGDGVFRVPDNPNILGESNITFEQLLDGNHSLTLDATTINLNKSVGNIEPLKQLDVNGNLENTTTNLTQITTHNTIQTEDINSQEAIHIQSLNADIQTGNISSQETIHLQSPNADIQTGNLTTQKDVVLEGQHIQTGNIASNARLTITSPQTLTTGNLTAPTIDAIQAQGDINTGNINTYQNLDLTTTQGNLTTGNITTPARNVTLKAPTDIETGFINTTHPIHPHSGDVLIDGGQTVQIDGQFTDPNGINTSISTVGTDTSGSIEIRHGGDGIVPFTVGDASTNGSSAAITRGTHTEGTIAPGNTYRYTHYQDQNQIAIISRPAPPPTPNTQPPTSQTLLHTALAELLPGNNALEQLAYLIGNVLNAETTISRDANNDYDFAWSVPGENPDDEGTILNASAGDPVLELTPLESLASLGIGLNSDDLVSDVDQFLEDQYEDYFEDKDKVPVTTAGVRQMLKTIEEQTQQRSVILYALSRPHFLQLLLIVPEGPPIPQTIPLVTPRDLRRAVRNFRSGVMDSTQQTAHLQPAQQLYDWLIRPYENALNNLNIDTLIFSMDAGLRSIPLAALHDGEQFLVENYSVGMIPSVSLTNSSYTPLGDAQVLAMGASEFRGLSPLPAVPVELEMVTQSRNAGTAYLNAAFTLDTLQAQSRDRNHRIIHLATHAKFLPIQRNGVNNSYIQFWNQAVDFQDLRSLGWHNDPQIELLVLSACETALGDPDAELGFAGLAVQTGVKSALASLWQVSDVGTLGLMAAFYEHLNDPTITIKAEALRQAQLALLRGDVTVENGKIGTVPLPPQLVDLQGDLSHPFFWSSFTLVGSPW